MSIGAAPGLIDASIHGRCAGEGFGVHICTGLVFGDDAEPGDVPEVRILGQNDSRHGRTSCHQSLAAVNSSRRST